MAQDHSVFSNIQDNRTSSLAEQVADQINQVIIDQNINAGEKLPNEFELAARLNVGRGTIREAVKLLVARNCLEIRRGKGTFVADPNNNRRGVRYSFTTEVSSLGKTPSSTLVDFGVVIPTRAICQRMDLQEGTPVYCFTRVRNVDGEPLIF